MALMKQPRCLVWTSESRHPRATFRAAPYGTTPIALQAQLPCVATPRVDHARSIVWSVAVRRVTNGRFRGPRTASVILEANTTAGVRALTKAKRRLAQMDGIGLTRDFERSLRVMAWSLGIPLEHYCTCNMNPFKSYKVAGAHYKRPYLSAEARRKLARDNLLDLELYQFAETLYKARLAQYKSAHNHNGVSASESDFSCDRASAVCKSLHTHPAAVTKWVPMEQYRRNNKAIELHGIHSECSFSCSRSSR